MNAMKHQDDNIESPAWLELQREMDALEASLVELTHCMQKERECLTLFDVEGLRDVVARKEEATHKLVRSSETRVAVITNVWKEVGRSDELPEDIPEALAKLADETKMGRFKTWLLDTASALRSLQDVVNELQQLNRTMMGRAMRWMTAYIAELHGGSNTYDASGRVVSKARATLARTI